MALTVRDATAGDVLGIRAVAHRAWPMAYAGLLAPEFIEVVLERAYSAESLSGYIADPDACFLVAEDGGLPVGFLHYTPGELHRLYLEPERIGSGAGHALLAELERRLEPGTEYVALVRRGNERALAFYARHGFLQAGHVDGFRRFAETLGVELPGEPQSDVLMRRRVPGVRS